MNTNDFIKYLEGYLDGKPNGLLKEDIEVLKNKIKEITPDINIKEIFPDTIPWSPYPWWGVYPPDGNRIEITCSSTK